MQSKAMVRPGEGSRFRAGLMLAVILGVLLWSAVGQAQYRWETWHTETYTLEPRESFQFRVTFDDIQVRSWKLVVDGQDHNCDLSVLRVKGESLLYYKTNESRHEVLVPWGKGEELIVVLTNRRDKATFTVDFLGPPRDQVHAAYSYHVNRALEAFAAGRRLDAQDECGKALREDDRDDVAKVLLASFLREGRYYTRAAALVDEALRGELPPEMRTLAEDLQSELVVLRAPLAPAIRDRLDRINSLLDKGEGDRAVELCDEVLREKALPLRAKSLLHLLRGRALDQQERDFEAVDAYTTALGLARSKAEEAVIYFHMGRLYRKMGNQDQARGAFTIALQAGLPSGLELQARENLKTIESHPDH